MNINFAVILPSNRLSLVGKKSFLHYTLKELLHRVLSPYALFELIQVWSGCTETEKVTFGLIDPSQLTHQVKCAQHLVGSRDNHPTRPRLGSHVATLSIRSDSFFCLNWMGFSYCSHFQMRPMGWAASPWAKHSPPTPGIGVPTPECSPSAAVSHSGIYGTQGSPPERPGMKLRWLKVTETDRWYLNDGEWSRST